MEKYPKNLGHSASWRSRSIAVQMETGRKDKKLDALDLPISPLSKDPITAQYGELDLQSRWDQGREH